MKTPKTKRKITEAAIGAAVGAAIAGPVGAVAGAIVGHEAAAHVPRPSKEVHPPVEREREATEPLVHAQLRRILVPVDFSPSSRQALRFAREWAGRFGSEVILLHVIEPVLGVTGFGGAPIAPPVLIPDFHADARAELEKFVHQEFSDAVKVSVQLRDGVAFDEIALAARELDADLIIIPTHGRTGLAHVLMGSTAERVVRHAPCPVLTLRRAPGA